MSNQLKHPSAPAQADDAGLHDDRREISFVSLLRGCAALLVVYDHLIGSYLSDVKMSWLPATLISSFVTRPFAIIQDMGFLGVVLFFLISGFIITHVALRESRREFAIKRLLRIYPPLIASLLVIAVVEALQHHPLQSFEAYALGATLLNYFVIPQVVVNGVAWSLVIEMTFYAMAFCMLTWLKIRPFAACAALTTLTILIMLTSHMFGPVYFLFAASTTYVAYLLAGQALYFVWAGRISTRWFAALTAYVFFAIVLGIQLIQNRFSSASNSYGVSFLDAYLVFVVCMLAARWIKTPPLMEFFARTSYSLYLIHGPVGFLVLAIVVPAAGFTAGIIAALAAVVAVSALMYRFVEDPSQRLARYILRRTTRRPSPVSPTVAMKS